MIATQRSAIADRDLSMPDGQPADDRVLLAIVIVAYNGAELVRACLVSLDRHPLTLGRCEVHLIDNASTDGTPEMVGTEFPSVIVHKLDRNLGFSVSNNLVLARINSPYVLLLNPDTEARPGALDHMLLKMMLDDRIGMSGCRLVRRDGTFDHAAKRSFPTPLAAVAHFTKIGRRSSAGARLGQYRSPQVPERGVGPVDAINGAFMLVRREAVEQVGLLDESYWMYGEDLDWCYRFHQHGWRVIYDGRVEFVHVKGGSSGNHRRLRQNYAFHAAMARFYRKFYAGKRPWLDLTVFCGIGAKFVISATCSYLARSIRP